VGVPALATMVGVTAGAMVLMGHERAVSRRDGVILAVGYLALLPVILAGA
jgi:hypothetical protein